MSRQILLVNQLLLVHISLDYNQTNLSCKAHGTRRTGKGLLLVARCREDLHHIHDEE